MTKEQKTKYVFVVGGVMSGVGKGVAAASIGKILQSRGFNVTSVKIDPYVNIDAGTMNPIEHGEVFVLNDGTECDQDLGNYERFLNKDLSRVNYMTTGSVYLSVIERERSLKYQGKCVEVVPHIPIEVIDRINLAVKKDNADIITIEVGGTVGEYQNILFLEAIRMLKLKKPKSVVLVLVSYLPIQGKGGELKTKPTQYAVRTLNSTGLQPDIIIARSAVDIDDKRRDKIATNCGVEKKDIISAPDVDNIYKIPLNFERDKISGRILEKFSIKPQKKDMKDFRRFISSVNKIEKEMRIGIVGKYFGTGNFMLSDSYISVIEAIKHSAYALKRKPIIEWVDAENFKNLGRFDGIIVPGGFGGRGIDGKIRAINYVRKHNIPFIGLCYGMQLAVVEFARSVARLDNANSTEIDKTTPHPVINILPSQKEKIENSNYGGTMRLGAYPAVLKKGTVAQRAYGTTHISERHRHRYEVNPEYIECLEANGMIFSGMSPDKRLMEIMELPVKTHPFFIGTQFHPEFKSRPQKAHPIFLKFMEASLINKKRVTN